MSLEANFNTLPDFKEMHMKLSGQSAIYIIQTGDIFLIQASLCNYYKTVFLCVYVELHLHQFCMYQAEMFHRMVHRFRL